MGLFSKSKNTSPKDPKKGKKSKKGDAA